MSDNQQDRFKNLVTAFCNRSGSGRYYHLYKLADSLSAQALFSGALKNGSIKPEPIYGLDGYIAHEFLTRPRQKNPLLPRQQFNIESLSREFYEKDLHVEFDVTLCEVILENATNLPATLNIHPKSAQYDEFWRGIEPLLKDHPPQDIIFEILEYDIDKTADVSALRDMKSKGYGVWLDDFTINSPDDKNILAPNHDNRLAVFDGIYNVIKFDGPLVKSFMGCKDSQKDHGFTDECLIRLMNYLGNNIPSNISFVAEHVQNREEANILFNMGFMGVQGFNLDSKDFDYAAKKEALEAEIIMPL